MADDKTVWEKLQEKTKKVEELEKEYEDTKKEFLKDNKLEQWEKDDLKVIKTGLSAAQKRVDELKAEFKANKKKWEARAADLKTARKQYDELYDWNDQDSILDKIDESMEAADDYASEFAWLDAIDELDLMINYIEAPYKEYQKQLPFRDEYNRDRPKLQERADDLWNHQYSELDSVNHSLEQFDGPVESAEGAAEELRYDDACRYLKNAKETLDDVDEDIKKLNDLEEKCVAENNSILADVALYAQSKFDSVQEMYDAIENAREVAEEKMQKMEFEIFLAEAKVIRKKLDELKAQEEAKAKEKAAYDGKESILDDCNQKISEVTGTAVEISKAVVGTASSLMKTASGIAIDASKQDWESASQKIDGLKKDVEDCYKSFTEEKQKAEEKKLWDECQGVVAEVTEQVTQLVEWGVDKAKDVQKTAQDAIKKAADEKYPDACETIEKAKEAIGPLIEKLDAEKKAEVIYKGLKAAYDAQMKALEDSKFVAHKLVVAIIDQIKNIVEPVADYVSDKQFEAANELLEKTTELIKKAQAELERLAGVERTATTEIEKIKNKMAEAGDAAFETLKDIKKQLDDGLSEAENQVKEIETVEDAFEKAKELSGKAVEYAQKANELVKEKAGWEKKEKDLDAVEKQIEELKKGENSQAKELEDIAKAIKEKAEAESWMDAATELEDLKKNAKEAMEEHEEELQMASAEEEEEEAMQLASAEDEEEEEMQMASNSGQPELSEKRKKEREEEIDDIDHQVDQVLAEIEV